MSLKSRLDRIEKKLLQTPEIKITTNLWNEDLIPWPETPEAKRKIEAERGGCKIIWIEAKRGKNERI